MPRDGSGVYSKPAGTTAVAGTTIESAKYNSQVDDMVADLNAARPITAGGTGATTAAGAQTNLGLLPGTFGFRYGLLLSNNVSDATNDIDIAAGTAASDAASPILMTLASAITKRLDANWVVGTNQGGLDTGSIANVTYHVWLIQRSDTSVVDVLFSASATSPTMPANYDRKRRIGSFVRGAGAILTFNQVSPNKFVFSSPRTVRNNTAALASSLLGTGVPTGILCEPLLQTRLDWNASSNASINFGSAAAGSANINVYLAGGASAGNNFVSHYGGFLTDTSGQLYFSQTIGGGSLTVGIIQCFGWIDSFL